MHSTEGGLAGFNISKVYQTEPFPTAFDVIRKRTDHGDQKQVLTDYCS
jgi:hypothetical protein